MSTDLRANVRLFHSVVLGEKLHGRPFVPSDDVVRLRARMLVEEVFETLRAMFRAEFDAAENDAMMCIRNCAINVNLSEYADGLADVMYIAEGGFLAFGIDSRPVHAEVQRSNMAKAGGPVREDGKMMKPADWTPPDIEGVIQSQIDAAPEK